MWSCWHRLHDNVNVTKDEWKKPQVNTFYEHTKCGADVIDFISNYSSARINSKQWPVNSITFIFDSARTNTNTILAENKVKMSTHEFMHQLARALCFLSAQRKI